MDITPVVSPDRLLVRSYGGGGFVINERRLVGSILLFPNHVEAWPVQGLDALNKTDFRPLIEERPAIEVVLVGAGKRPTTLNTVLRESLRKAGIGADVMTTGAACRTYNVLVAEDRRVAAALIALQ